jgi:phosphatidylglycerophosphatase A
MTVETRCGRLSFAGWMASGFGLGFCPLAPGTAATLGIALLWGLLPPIDPPLHASLLAAVLIIGVPVTSHGERLFGHDAGCIVWDEFGGFLVTIWGLPNDWLVIALAFALFRLFDVTKIFPIRVSQRLPRGWGVMVDDVLAGIYANVALQLYFRLLA